MPRKKTPATPADQTAGVGCYRPAERKIYRYFDGRDVKAADPLAVERALHARGGSAWVEWLRTLESSAKLAGSGLRLEGDVAQQQAERTDAALRSLVGLVRGTFAVKPFDEGGLTDLECVELLSHFLAYQAGLAEDARLFLKPPSASDSPHSAASPTPPSSESSATASDC